MSTLKVNKSVQHDNNLVLGGFKDYNSILAGKLLKKLPKPLSKFTLNTVLNTADDTCLAFQHNDINEIEKQLNEYFESICDWFVDNKVSIHFDNDKTKSILFALKFKIKKCWKTKCEIWR